MLIERTCCWCHPPVVAAAAACLPVLSFPYNERWTLSRMSRVGSIPRGAQCSWLHTAPPKIKPGVQALQLQARCCDTALQHLCQCCYSLLLHYNKGVTEASKSSQVSGLMLVFWQAPAWHRSQKKSVCGRWRDGHGTLLPGAVISPCCWEGAWSTLSMLMNEAGWECDSKLVSSLSSESDYHVQGIPQWGIWSDNRGWVHSFC